MIVKRTRESKTKQSLFFLLEMAWVGEQDPSGYWSNRQVCDPNSQSKEGARQAKPVKAWSPAE